MSGAFITVEGIEGCGKTTQMKLLGDRLEEAGTQVERLREPGGTAIGEAIRTILLDANHDAMAPVAELLLYEAARAQLVRERIRPAVEAGRIVLCDRFADSTTAYQGAGRELAIDMVLAMHHVAVQGMWPDLTILIDVPVETGLARIKACKRSDRIEQEPPAFHERVRNGFLRLAEKEPGRISVVDGTQPVEAVAGAIWRAVDAFLGSR